MVFFSLLLNVDHQLFQSMLRTSGLLDRCPYASYAGAISQIAALYDMSHVSGIFVLDWVPSHLPLAKLAFESLPLQGARPLQLVRFSRRSRSGRHEPSDALEHDGEVSCSCHDLPWVAKPLPDTGSRLQSEPLPDTAPSSVPSERHALQYIQTA